MDTTVLLQMVKDSLGLKSTARDTRLQAVIGGVIKELEDEQGLVLDGTNPYHLLFVTDYAAWRFEHPNEAMPRHLQFRLHNMIIHVGSALLSVNNIIVIDALPVSPMANIVYILPDGSRQMFINEVWTTVAMENGSWVVT